MFKNLKTKNSVNQDKITPMMTNLLTFAKQNIRDKSIIYHECFEDESRKQKYRLKC